MIHLTERERYVMCLVRDGVGTLNAKDYAEPIVSLLRDGFLRLGGTLAHATVELTDKGKAQL
jgi:hypothetical protein